MPAYKTTSTHYEDRVGIVTTIFIIADTFAALSDPDAAIEVAVFDWDSISQDIDIASGVIAADEIDFTISPVRAVTEDDDDAVTFALEAQEAGTWRYVAVLINPADPVVDDDFAFRGAVSKSMSAEAIEWDGAEYGDIVTPLWEWKAVASAYEAATLLENKLKDLVAAIDAPWKTANIADRLGAIKHGTRDIRWGDLVRFDVLMQKLLDLAAPAGVTFVYQPMTTNLWCYRARWEYASFGGGSVKVRWHQILHPQGPQPWDQFGNRIMLLELGETLYVNWRLLAPQGDAEGRVSWLRYDTLVKLLAALAFNFGLFLKFDYNASEITVRFTNRNDIISTAVYLRDAAKDAVDVGPVESSSERDAVVGVATPLLREGNRWYKYDGGFVVDIPENRAATEGELLPLVIAPSSCALFADASDSTRQLSQFSMPHNGIFYDGGIPAYTGGYTVYPVEAYDLRGIHAALYIETTGSPSESDLDGETIVMPVTAVAVNIDGEDQVFTEMAAYVNALTHRDAAYFEAERTIEVPYLAAFRSNPVGADDWRNCRLGRTLELDDQSYAIVGLVRKRLGPSTELRLHLNDRFNLPESSNTTEAPPMTAAMQTPRRAHQERLHVRGYEAGEDIKTDDAIAVNASGIAYRAVARHEHYGKIIGIALTDTAEGDVVDVQYGGRIQLESFTATAGDRIHVRTVGYPAVNISATPLIAQADPEDMIVPLGVMVSDSVLLLDLQQPRIFYPPLPDMP